MLSGEGNVMKEKNCRIENLNKKLSVLLFQLFVTNTYAMAFQREDGKYITKYLPISEYLIEEMLNQGGSIGCYQQCYKSNMVKWICFDFDSPKKYDPDLHSLYENNVAPLKRICDEYNIRYLTEFSGRRGIHLWIIFSHLIPKDKAFYILNFLKNKLLHQIGEFKNANLDSFPATDSSKGNVVGKQVKLPLSIHKSGSQSWFFEGNFTNDIEENREQFLKRQLSILKEYVVNDYETVIKSIGLKEDDYAVRLKYRKYQVGVNLNLSIWDTISILSETNVYKKIFQRLIQGKAFRQDWLVIMGTFSPLNDGGIFVKELYSVFPNYDVKKTEENINKYKDMYYPATFEYLYKIYGMEIEESLDKTDTGYSYLLKKKGINPKTEENYLLRMPKNESEMYVEDTLRKEIKYIVDNDEVLNISIWNQLHSLKQQDIRYLEKIVEKILNAKIDNTIETGVVSYERKENENKIRKLVSLEARDRILTTHIALMLQNRLKGTWNSFSYNISFCSREDIFYNWYSSWSEYLNKIKTFLEIPFMGTYEVFTIDLKGFYDHIDFMAVYSHFEGELGEEERNMFKYLVDYNDIVMRKLSGGKRKGVPQGPAYARIISEMYLDSIITSILSRYDKSKFHLYRYVDDIIVFVKPENNSSSMYNFFVNGLISYGLPVNEEKSCWYGSIQSLNQEERRKILRKDKFTYDLQDIGYKGFVTLTERKKDIDRYLNSNEFEVGDISMFFSKKTYYEASEGFCKRYAGKVMGSLIGRGSAFKRFYDYLLTHPNEFKYAITNGYFNLIPLNSINFGNFLGELYFLIQKHQISSDELSIIQNMYLDTIDDNNLSDEYRVLVDSLKKIRIKVAVEDDNGF